MNKHISDAKKELGLVKSFFGKDHMLRIIYEATNRRSSVGEQISQVKSKLEKYQNAPLLEITINGVGYKAVLSPMKGLVTGEYKTYDEVIKIDEAPPDFAERLGIIDSLIAQNAKSVYDSLPLDIRNNNKEFECIKRSMKRSYLYYYKYHENKSFGIIFVENN
jgi:hypothetical protein